jgi:hypothetical protein
VEDIMARRFAALVAASLFVGLALPSGAFAQGGRAEINGTVFDQAKAVLPGATVTVTEENTRLSRSSITSGDGRFVIPTLLPGTYTIRAELPGFQTVTQTGVVLNVGQELTANLTLQVGGVTEEVQVTGESPLVEVTSSRVGTVMRNAEIDSLPSQGRNQLSLMQLVPGLTPSLLPGSFEGGQYNANGQATTANLFLVDGAYDNDDRRGGSQGTQARVTLDTMAEYEVLTHHYSAEYGGSSGVVVNAVTRSGTNQVSGRAFWYYQNEDLNATNYFLAQAGEENPEASSDVFGGSIGAPIVRNKAFVFANVERNLVQEAANLNFPANAAPLAVSYSDTTDFRGWNTFVRGDYQVTGNNHLSFRWVREAVLTENDELEGNNSTPDNATFENDSGDQVYSFAWTSVMGTRATNEFRVGHVRENLLQGPRIFFDEDWNFIGLNGREQFDLGSMNAHPDYNAGNRNNYQEDLIRSVAVENSFTYFKPGWNGDHTFKAGVGWSRNAALPQGMATNLVGLFDFPTNTAFDQANPRTYPFRFRIRLGQIDFDQKDWRTNFLRAGQVAGRQAGDAQSGVAVRVSAPHAVVERRFLPAIGYRLRRDRQRQDPSPCRRGQVLSAPPVERPCHALDERSHRSCVPLRHDASGTSRSDGRHSDGSVQFRMSPADTERRAGLDRPGVPRIPRHAPGTGRGRRLRQQSADRRWQSAAPAPLGVQRRHQAPALVGGGRLGRLRRERGAQSGPTGGHQRGTTDRERPHHESGRGRLRSGW